MLSVVIDKVNMPKTLAVSVMAVESKAPPPIKIEMIGSRKVNIKKEIGIRVISMAQIVKSISLEKFCLSFWAANLESRGKAIRANVMPTMLIGTV